MTATQTNADEVAASTQTDTSLWLRLFSWSTTDLAGIREEEPVNGA